MVLSRRKLSSQPSTVRNIVRLITLSIFLRCIHSISFIHSFSYYAYIHTFIHTHIHTYIHIYIHMHIFEASVLPFEHKQLGRALGIGFELIGLTTVSMSYSRAEILLGKDSQLVDQTAGETWHSTDRLQRQRHCYLGPNGAFNGRKASSTSSFAVTVSTTSCARAFPRMLTGTALPRKTRSSSIGHSMVSTSWLWIRRAGR